LQATAALASPLKRHGLQDPWRFEFRQELARTRSINATIAGGHAGNRDRIAIFELMALNFRDAAQVRPMFDLLETEIQTKSRLASE
jgi:hypothetical protein